MIRKIRWKFRRENSNLEFLIKLDKKKKKTREGLEQSHV
jgi:hypothetical protein